MRVVRQQLPVRTVLEQPYLVWHVKKSAALMEIDEMSTRRSFFFFTAQGTTHIQYRSSVRRKSMHVGVFCFFFSPRGRPPRVVRTYRRTSIFVIHLEKAMNVLVLLPYTIDGRLAGGKSQNFCGFYLNIVTKSSVIV